MVQTILIKDTSQNENTIEFYNQFMGLLRQSNLHHTIQVVRVFDIGVYNKGIVMRFFPENITYVNVKEKDLKRIIGVTLNQEKVIDNLVYKPKVKQIRIVLRNCGKIDPESIDDYIEMEGYAGLTKVLKTMKPKDAIEEMKVAGLRGRGGGGFPAWMKWNFAKSQSEKTKYVICNADEGDPGAYMDRSVLEGDPHSVLEGMVIAGYSIGSNYGYIYCRAEYPLAIERLNKAIEDAKEKGFLGKNILGSNFDFKIEVRLGAGAFVCGEETALIASLEGKRGTPSPKPPYPSVKGLWGKPTIINNVETLANVPWIFVKGGKEFAKIGTDDSKGTKVFAVTGKIANSGLVEVPMGTNLKDIVYDLLGGVLGGKEIKAVQTGGPSGGIIPKEYLDIPVEYGSLQKLGSIMGSGGMIVIDETDCVIDLAKFYLQFGVDESCGKCAPCRLGGYQMLGILDKISKGNGEMEDLDKLRSISKAMQKTSLCGLGQTVPNPVISTMKYFEEEYIEHIKDNKCRAGKCTDLLNYTIEQEKCRKCGLCVKRCPNNAILGNRESGYMINQKECIKCGQCYEVCKFKAIRRD